MHVALLLSGILVHGYIPDDLSISTIIPIHKGKNSNDFTNYKGIALSSIFCKIFDLIVLGLCNDKLITSDLQFGLKRNGLLICAA